MECFRIDESGYTGFDLLNHDQPFQGATAIAIDDNEAARLIREHFPKLQAPELKYRALSRRPGMRIPRPSGHLFHEHPATDSTMIRPPIPRSSGHP